MYRLAVSIIAGGFLAAGSSAYAEDAGWYLGVGAGLSKADLDTDFDIEDVQGDVGTVAQNVINRVDIDDEDTGWKLFGGYQFNKLLAVEFAYVDLGEPSSNVVISEPVTVTLGTEADSIGISLSAIGTLALSNSLSALGKAGIYRWDTNVKALSGSLGSLSTVSEDDSGTDLVYGVGLKYEFTGHLGVRVEWERYQDVSDIDFDLYSVSAFYRF
ncbi:MAG: outer membrane beta-barrel protein [Gammaproteobacteria bacterium]|nr:outer membrane beta-barrel protein [Gammaproteobacteria bacterium]